VQVRILPSQFLLVCRDCCFLSGKAPNVETVAVSVDMGTPGFVFGVEANPFHATLAVGSDTVMPASFFFGHYPQVLASAVKTVVIQKDDFVSWPRLHELPMQILGVVLSGNFGVSNRIALTAVAFGTIAPVELGERVKIFVVNKNKLVLGKGDLLRHDVPP